MNARDVVNQLLEATNPKDLFDKLMGARPALEAAGFARDTTSNFSHDIYHKSYPVTDQIKLMHTVSHSLETNLVYGVLYIFTILMGRWDDYRSITYRFVEEGQDWVGLIDGAAMAAVQELKPVTTAAEGHAVVLRELERHLGHLKDWECGVRQ